MTASRPTTARCNQANQTNNVLSKRTRGPINKRACQRCRQGKIKCDGDAETGKPCSNCDPQHCKYDNSPRKNKQVELLKHRLTDVEVQLEAITRDITEKLTIKDMEKEILCKLYESKEHFNSNPQFLTVFQELKDAVRQSRCIKPVLVITYELLSRLADNKNVEFVPTIMQNLQSFVEFADTYERDASISGTSTTNEVMNRIEENMQSSQAYENLPIMSLPTFPIQPPLNNADDQPLNLHSSSDESSEQGRYEFNEDVGSPTTPTESQQQPPQPTPQQQQQPQEVESKCYHGPGMQSSQDYSYPFTTYFYQNNDYSNYVDYAYLPMNEQPSTTSPTDDVGFGGFHN